MASDTDVVNPTSPPTSRPRVLKGTDLPALMTVLSESAYCAFQLGIQIGLSIEQVQTLDQTALRDSIKLLSLVLGAAMKQTSSPLTLETVVNALSRPPIGNKALAFKLKKHFVSDAGPEQHPSRIQLSSAMASYSEFLDIEYQLAAIPLDPKGGPKPSSKYIDLAVIKKEEDSPDDEDDTFTKATLHGRINRIMCKKKAIELKDIFQPEDGQANVNFVLAEGALGIGKSTMAWELCHMRHEIEATKAFAAVVLLRLREEEVQEANSVAELLYHDNPDIQQAVVQEICSTYGENILFILDGFDEVPQHLRKSMFIAKIISGRYLRKATVLVTSRPSAREDLLSLRIPDKHIKILGFTHELIEQYATNVFGSSSPLLADFLKYVSTNPAIKSMMYIPLNCAIVVEIYQGNREKGKPIPHTMTQLYSELTLVLIRRHHREKGGRLERFPTKLEDLSAKHSESHSQLPILAELAFNGTLKQKVIFEDLPASCSALGLMTVSQQLYVTRRGSANYSFFHLSMQEFLSAYYISQLTGSEQKEAFEKYSDENYSHMNVVWKFVAGLTGFGSIGWDLVRSRRGTTRFGRVSSFLIRCLYEAQQKEECERILGQRSELSFSSSSASASFACGYCVAVGQHAWKVRLRSRPESFEMFVYGLTSREEVHGSVSTLVLSHNPIGQEGIARLKAIPHNTLQQLFVLKVGNCKLDASALDQLSDAIPSMTSLERLVISANPAGHGGTVKLLETLHEAATSHLHTLDMASIPISCDDIMALSHLISPSGGPKALLIGDEDMQCDSIELLLKVVFSPSSLQTLELWDMNVKTTSPSFTSLERNRNIINLVIFSCTIGSKDVSKLTEVLRTNTTLEKVRIGSYWDVDDPGQVTRAVGDLADTLKDVNRSLKKFCLYLQRPSGGLTLGREEAQALINTLQCNRTLEQLKLPDCHKYFSDEQRRAMDPRLKLI